MTDQLKLAERLSAADKQVFEDTVARFETAWHQTGQPEISDYLPPTGPLRLVLLTELVAIDIEFRQQLGQPSSIEDYQQRFPELTVSPVVATTAAQTSTHSQAQDSSIPATPIRRAAPNKIPKQFGRYSIKKTLGEGAMGAVYLALDQQLDRQVALKIPKFSGAESKSLLDRFYREARLAAMLRHPNICPVFDVGEINGQHYISMAFIEGRPLNDFVSKSKTPSIRQVVSVVRKLALGLAEAHAHGVIHRDLKPANVMVDTKGEPIIMDFGLARRESPDQAIGTRDGTLVGTPAYMSPEQFEGDQQKIGPRADIYSLGVILYELITGVRPYVGPVMSIMYQISHQDPQRPSELRTDLDPALEAICLKMMARRQENRYDTMKDVAQALTEYLKSGLTDYLKSGNWESNSSAAMTGLQAPDPTTATAVPISQVDSPPAATVIPPPKDESPFAINLNPTLPIPAAKTRGKSMPKPNRATQTGAAMPEFAATQRGRLLIAVGSGMAALLLLWAATFYFRVGNVDVKVVINDPGLSVKFDNQTVTFEGSGTPIRLKPGPHKFIIERDGLESETDNFTVKKNGQNILDVSIVDGQVVVQKGNATAPTKKLASKTGGSSTPKIGWHGWPADAPRPAIAPFDAAQAKKHQEEWAAYLKLPVEYTNSIGMKFRLIPPGEFMMGSTKDEIEAALRDVESTDAIRSDWIKSEGPRHKVVITRAFFICVTEATQRQYAQLMTKNPSYFCVGGAGEEMVGEIDTNNLPVETVSYADAVEFCSKLSNQEQAEHIPQGRQETNGFKVHSFRLPTEAEWEFACRAGTQTRYSSGDSESDLEKVGWCRSNAQGRTHFVGDLPANAFGLHDMHGNVFEWCQDSWGKSYYQQFETIAALNPLAGRSAGLVPVYRGGDWFYTASWCRSAARYGYDPPAYYGNRMGIRAVLPVEAIRARLLGGNAPTTGSANSAAKWQPTSAFQQWMKDVAAMPAEQQVDAVVKKLQELNTGYDGKVQLQDVSGGTVSRLELNTNQLANIAPLAALKQLKSLGLSGSLGKGKLVDLSPLTGLSLLNLTCSGNPGLSDLSPLRGMPLQALICNSTNVRDLSPLSGMKLISLHCIGTPVSHLSPLQGMQLVNLEAQSTKISDLSPLSECDSLKNLRLNSTLVTDLSPLNNLKLTFLAIQYTNVRDLSPLSKMPLNLLDIRGTKVVDLSPLSNMPLTTLGAWDTSITDWSPLKTCPLVNLECVFVPARDTVVLRAIKSLQNINRKPAADFWKEVNEKQADFHRWMNDVAKMPAEEQVKAVARKLQELNPGFDGKVSAEFEKGEIRGLHLITDRVTDISPIRAIVGLKKLACVGSGRGTGQLSDLWPLHELPLVHLFLSHNRVSDLSPLRGMQLTILDFAHSPVQDLRPLKGMPLTKLWCVGTYVSDLSPLVGMSLTDLGCAGTQVFDLSPLKGMPLTVLGVNATKVVDFSPLKELPLKSLWYDFKSDRNAEIVRSIKTLEAINDKPVADFWKEVGKPMSDADADPARFAAVWAIGLGGSVGLREPKQAEVKHVKATGDLPPRIELVSLQLPGSRVVDVDLQPLLQLEALYELEIFGPGCSNSVLEKVGRIRGVQRLFLHGNQQITDDGLAPLKNLHQLEYLNLNGTAVRGSGLKYLKALPKLSNLYLSNTPITDDELRAIQDLTHLTELYLENAQVTDAAMVYLSKLPELESLRLNNTGVGDAGLESLAKIRTLKGVMLTGTKVTDAGMSYLARLPALTGLELSETGVGDAGVKSLVTARNLSDLWLHNTKVTDAGLIALADMPKLVVLGLNNTAITDAGLKHLQSARQVSVIYLQGTQVSASGVAGLQQALPKCRVVWDASAKSVRSM